MALIDVPPGLAGVAVTDTAISDVVGEHGYYHYRGRPVPDLARSASYETVAALLLDGSDDPLDLDRSLPPDLADIVGRLDLRSALSAAGRCLGMSALSDCSPEQRHRDAVRLIGLVPTLVASVMREEAVAPDPGLSHAADYLRMMTGSLPGEEVLTAFEAYLVLAADHGFSNSSFATRVVASAGADLAGCAVAGFVALSGPRHGANLERMLDMYDGIGEPDNAEAWLLGELSNRRRLQGFGHSVYRSADPRLELLREHGARIAPARHQVAMAAEEAGTRLLAGRRLGPNLDLHAAVVLEGCGIPRGWFTPTFAVARVAGWCAHALEQVADNRILRPAARYVGPAPDAPVY